MMNIKDHIKTFWWAYPLTVLLIAWPLCIWHMHRSISRVDLTYVKDILDTNRQIINTQFPGALEDSAVVPDEGYARNIFNMVGYGRSENTNFNKMIRTSGEEARRDLDNIDAEAYLREIPLDGDHGKFENWQGYLDQDDYFCSLELLDLESMYNKPLDEHLTRLDNDYLYHYSWTRGTPGFSLAFRTRAKFAIADRLWDIALEQSRYAVKSGNPVLPFFSDGFQSAMVCRIFGFSSYDDLMAVDPPAEVSSQAWDDLIALRQPDATQPLTRWTEHPKSSRALVKWELLMREHPNQLQAAREVSYITPEVLVFSDAHAMAMFASPDFDSERLEKMGERINTKLWTRHGWYFPTHGSQMRRGYQWTFYPAVRKWLHAVAENEAEIKNYEAFLPYDAEALKKCRDRYTLIRFFGGSTFAESRVNNAFLDHLYARTSGGLQELAFAVRVYYHRNGEWPDDMEDLRAMYRSRGIETPFPDTQGYMYSPFQMTWIRPDEDWLRKFWAHRLNLDANAEHLEWAKQKDGSTGLIVSERDSPDYKHNYPDRHVWLTDLSRFIMDADAIARHDKIVKKMEIQVRYASDPADGWQTIQRDEFINIARKHYLDRNAGKKYFEDLRLVLEMKAPEKVLTIWAPGPDRIDNKAQILYTSPYVYGIRRSEYYGYSRLDHPGDMVVFPEGY